MKAKHPTTPGSRPPNAANAVKSSCSGKVFSAIACHLIVFLYDGRYLLHKLEIAARFS